jgi:hypothetical protein
MHLCAYVGLFVTDQGTMWPLETSIETSVETSVEKSEARRPHQV